MAQYQRLDLMEREELSRMLAAGHSLRAVAQAIQRAPSTLSRELMRHRTSPTTYRAVPAHHRACAGLITRASLERWRPSRACAPRSSACLPTAGRPNRLLTAYHSGILTNRPCGSLTKPSIPIFVYAAVRGLEAGTRSVSAPAPSFSSAAQGPPFVAAYSGLDQ